MQASPRHTDNCKYSHGQTDTREKKPYRGMPAYTRAWACVGQLRHINAPVLSPTDAQTLTGQALWASDFALS